jgi:hypothetical protein
VDELQLALVALGVAHGGAVQLRRLGERPHVAAEQYRVEAQAERLLPSRGDAQRELEVAVDVADDRDGGVVAGRFFRYCGFGRHGSRSGRMAAARSDRPFTMLSLCTDAAY